METVRKQRREEHMKEFRRADTVVFWDVVGCKIPHGVSVIEVSEKIRSGLVEMKYKGKEATIYAYGEQIHKLSGSTEIFKKRERTDDKISIVDLDYRGTELIYADQNQVDLQSPAIVFNHTPAGDKDGRLTMLLTGMFFWAMDHPGPANLMIILGDLTDAEFITTHNQFISAICHLRSARYNVLLVHPENARQQLPGTARERYIWEDILAGRIIDITQEPLNKTERPNETTSLGKPTHLESQKITSRKLKHKAKAEGAFNKISRGNRFKVLESMDEIEFV